MSENLTRVAAALLLGFSFIVVPGSVAWSQPYADEGNTASTGEVGSGNGTPEWARTFPTAIDYSAAATPDTVLVHANQIHALDAETGAKHWTFWPSGGTSRCREAGSKAAQ